MLFDPRPKVKREDLFDRERELEDLYKNIDKPIIVLTGIRRIGKTSLLLVFLNEIDIPSIILDLRGLKPNYGLRDLYRLLAKAFSKKLDKFRDILERIRAITIAGVEIEIKWKGREAISLSTLFDYLNYKRTIIAFDEAQKLRGSRSKMILEAIAHAYDYDENLTFIFTGSEVGLLYQFLGVDNPKSPLYGRYMHTISIERFKHDESIEFLKRGFNELGIKPPQKIIEEAVDLFNGIPGWLTFFGNSYAGGIRDVNKIKEYAIRIALNELENLVKERGSRRYAIVLKAIALGYNTWGKIKRYVEEVEGKIISNSILSNILNTLENLSIIKNYEFLDPIYKEASKRLKIRP